MTAVVRKLNSSARPSAIDALAAFIARAEARVLLFEAGELNLHETVDELQAAAVRDGLVEQLGQDGVQRLIVAAFEPEDARSAPSWHKAAVEYDEKRGGRTLVVEIEPERLVRLRELITDEVLSERAYAELS